MLDEAHWPQTCALIEEACGVEGHSLGVSEDSGAPSRVRFAGIYRRGERRPDLEREYFEVYHPRDERASRLKGLPGGRLVHVPDLYTEAELKTSFVYNEGLPRFGSQHGVGAHFAAPDGLRIFWFVGNPVGGAWQSAQIRLIKHLLPHLPHLVRVRQALVNADALGLSLTRLLDNSRIGVLHLHRSGRVLAANDPALHILRSADGLSDAEGALHAWLPADHERLRKLLHRALPALWGEPPAGGSMKVRRPSGRSSLALHVSPVGSPQKDLGTRRVAALVLLVDPADRSRIDPERIAATLDLTPAESRVASLLAEGNSVRDIAAATGNQPGTVRLFLKLIYRKQGVSGQVPLVRRVLAVDALPHP